MGFFLRFCSGEDISPTVCVHICLQSIYNSVILIVLNVIFYVDLYITSIACFFVLRWKFVLFAFLRFVHFFALKALWGVFFSYFNSGLRTEGAVCWNI